MEKSEQVMESLGRALLGLGILLAITGGVLLLFSRLPFLSNLGHLPGDIRIEGQGFSCFIPLASMLLISVVLTILLNVILRILRH